MTAQEPEIPSAPEPLTAVEWSWNPWRERPGRALVALVFTLGAWLLLWSVTHTPLMALVLALAVGGSLSPLLVSQRCRVDAERVAVRGAFGWERRAWSQIRRARLKADGVMLSPFARPRRLEVFRALFLPVPPTERDRVFDLLRIHLRRQQLS